MITAPSTKLVAPAIERFPSIEQAMELARMIDDDSARAILLRGAADVWLQCAFPLVIVQAEEVNRG